MVSIMMTSERSLVESGFPRCTIEGSVGSRWMRDYLYEQQDSCRLVHLRNGL